ncbi:MAG: hypothetical protein IT200_08650 [Thermoleophilia bacterium]|nr:hypothetical protein [Thermoleophilia bacterium]
MSEETEGTVAEEAVEEAPAAETEVAVAEPAAEAEEAVEEQDEAPADEPVAETAAEPVAAATPLRREALVYLCERGHRTLIMFGEPPATCNAQITRNQLCGRQIYHMTELPEQVQKALNPIKASKKKAGKK